MSEDYYKILGVEKGSSESEIKKAFRKKAQETHPDKTGGDDSQFKKINEAYSVLGDKQKKANYDNFGKSGASGGFGGGSGGFDFSQGFSGGGGNFSGAEFDMGDIFESFFSGGARRNSGRPRQKVGSDISVNLEISFFESIFGVEKTFFITKNLSCNECSGSGAKNKKTKTCHNCNGDGSVYGVSQTFLGNIQTQKTCGVCDGKGKIPEEKCKSCTGSGTVRARDEINVKIPAGIEHGMRLKMPGRGEVISGGVSGDLFIRISVKNETNFSRIGNDLKTKIKVPFSELVLGSKREIETLEGSLKIKIPEGMENKGILKVKKYGVPYGKTRGDLLIEVFTETPKKISRSVKKVFEDLQKEGY